MVQWLRLCTSNAGGAGVLSLVAELRSHTLSSAAKEKKRGSADGVNYCSARKQVQECQS